jgi:hypothetical protein
MDMLSPVVTRNMDMLSPVVTHNMDMLVGAPLPLICRPDQQPQVERLARNLRLLKIKITGIMDFSTVENLVENGWIKRQMPDCQSTGHFNLF